MLKIKNAAFPNPLYQKFPLILYFHEFHSYADLVEKFAEDKALQAGRTLHAHLIVNGLARKPHFGTKLISLYTECKELNYAQKVFDKIPESNVRRWIVFIGCYSRNGFYREAMDAFFQMRKAGVSLSEYVLPSVLKACGHLSDLRTGEKTHSLVVKCEFESDPFVITALIDMYSKCGKFEEAKMVFDSMAGKDPVSLNAMVSGYVQHGMAVEALSLVQEMKLIGVKPNAITWNTIIAGFSQENDESMVSEAFRLMAGDGFEPDLVSWTSVISGFVHNFRNKEAFHAFKQMLGSGILPNTVTLSGLLPACANVADLRRGKELHGYAKVTGMEMDIFVMSALIDMYSKCGNIIEAKALFDRSAKRTTVTWNSMIFGYANNGNCEKAIELFNEMVSDRGGSRLDHLSFTAVLSACCHGGMVSLGERLFVMMQEKYGIEPRLEHYASMVDLLGRAGKLDEAYDFLQSMPVEPDLFVWGALLGACKHHGNVRLAEIAADRVAGLELESRGSRLLLSNLYGGSSRWGMVTRLKKDMKKRKLKGIAGSSWIQVV